MKRDTVCLKWFCALLVVLAACNPTVKNPAVIFTDTPAPAATQTITPTLAATPTPTPTVTPTPTPDANDLLKKNKQAMEALKTGSMKMIMTMEFMGQTLEINSDTFFEKPKKAYSITTTLGNKIEAVGIQPDLFTRTSGSEVWVKSTIPESTLDYQTQLSQVEYAKSAALEGEETLEGAKNYVVAYDLDMGKFISKDPTLSKMANPLKSSGKGKTWMDQQNYLTHKISLNMELDVSGTKIKYTLEGSFGDFDQPVQIPNPSPYYDQIVLHANDPVFAVAFSPDSNLLAACDDDQMIYLWPTSNLDAKPDIIEHPDLKIKEMIVQSADFYSLAFSPDGKTLAAGSQGQVLLYSLSNLKAEPTVLQPANVMKEAANDFQAVAYSPDGKFLAAGGAGNLVYLWKTASLKTAPSVQKGHQSPIADLIFTPDSQKLISGSEDGTIMIWSVQNPWSPQKTLKAHKEDFHGLDLTPDGKYLMTVSFKEPVYAWSLPSLANKPDTLIPREDVNIGKSPTLEIAISPDGKTIATADTFGTVRLWSLADPDQPFAVLPLNSQQDLLTIAFSPNGKYLSVGSADNSIYVWVLDPRR